MDIELSKLIKQHTPHINLDLARGLATIHMKHSLSYVDSVFRAAARDFPQSVNYEGYRVCNPFEYYELMLRKKGRHTQPIKSNVKNSQVRYETSAYDYYMVEFKFSYNGEEVKAPMLMPYVGQAGSIKIKGTQWYISPVLADRVISIGEKNIFVRLQRDRVTFNRDPYRYKEDGLRQDFSLIHSLIYHTDRKKGKLGPKMVPKGKTTMVHYLYCKRGLSMAFGLYAGCTPIIGEDLSQIVDTNEYTIFSTVGIPPNRTSARAKLEMWKPPTIQVAVKKSEVNNVVRALVTGLYYLADLFPKHVTPSSCDDPETWIMLMGFLLFPETMNRGIMREKVINHCESLDGYADPMVIESMRTIGINITDIYQFFAIIASDFDDRLLNGATKVNSMYDKEMSVLYFVFFDLTYAIFNMLFGLKAAAKKQMQLRDVENVIKTNLKMTVMHDLQKIHGEVQNLNYSGDNMALKATASLIPQTSTNKMRGNKGSERGVAQDATKRLHVSVAEIGAVSAMSKADPTGRNHMNHHTLLSPHDKSLVIRNSELEETLDIVQEMIRRR